MSSNRPAYLSQQQYADDPIESFAPAAQPETVPDPGLVPPPAQEDAITCMYNSLVLLQLALKTAVRRRFRPSSH